MEVDAEFAAYAQRHWRGLVRTAYLLTGDRDGAEDLAQATLARVMMCWGRLRADGNIDAYVRRVMVSINVSWWRRCRRREQPSSALPEAVGPDTTDAVVDRAALLAALAKLPARQRAAVVLRYLEDLSEAETAAALGCSIGTVKSQAARGVAKLREDMRDVVPLPARTRRQPEDAVGVLDEPA